MQTRKIIISNEYLRLCQKINSILGLYRRVTFFWLKCIKSNDSTEW